MLYNSTQDNFVKVSSAEAIARGISPEGGLFVPESFPQLEKETLEAMLSMSYQERAKLVISYYLSDFSEEEIDDCVYSAYTKEKFGSKNPAPISAVRFNDKEMNLLELWHGPTCAFKDMALQILPHFLTKALKKAGGGLDAVILVATSGDTGKAALEGFKDVEHTNIIVFYPALGVSPMQKHQMSTQEGDNVYVCAINGNFDDAQTAVKKIFTDEETIKILNKNSKMFSSANSINFGRLLPQIVYYISAYCDMVNLGKIELGDKINITVPTGNFGNILAGYYAYRMGLPVNKFICASNSNNVLTDFINTGVYNKNREFYTTMSPSMDILVSSNLERLLYHLSSANDAEVKGYMSLLKENGIYEVSSSIKEQIKDMFYGGFCDEDSTKATIKGMFVQQRYLCDTHTAVAVSVYNDYVDATGDKTPTVIASTASPYKFCRSVLESFGCAEMPDSEFDMVDKLFFMTQESVPAPLMSLKDKQPRFTETVDKEQMQSVVFKALGIS